MKKILLITLVAIGINCSAQKYKDVQQELTSVYMEYTDYQPLGSTIQDVYVVDAGDAMALHKELLSKNYKRQDDIGKAYYAKYTKDGFLIEISIDPVKYTSRYETKERYVNYVHIRKDPLY